ncbi:MAG: [FeFe] hydrogenase H-cluster maturation GTPase HydF [Candidatus Goldiibacteriota bacterium]
MNNTPAANRLQIGIFGRRNSGKSSFINALTGQDIAITSETPGTTTDPVGKTIELKGLGPVYLYDTAGLDDIGELGEKRKSKSMDIVRRINMAVLVSTYSSFDGFEEALIEEFTKNNTEIIVIFNKTDIEEKDEKKEKSLSEKGIKNISLSCASGAGINEARKLIVNTGARLSAEPAVIISDLVDKGSTVVLVVPIDTGAPKGRIILPQVQVIRDCLDNDCAAVTVKETGLKNILNTLNTKPSLVICDSQAIEKVSKDTPDDIPLTTFSVAFSRLKGDLNVFAEGIKAVETLRDGDKILILEACSHHPQPDDIGRIQIPRKLSRYTGKNFVFDFNAGPYSKKDLAGYSLIISCGGCMINRREMLSRLQDAESAGIPVTNYGMLLAYFHGVFERVIKPFAGERAKNGSTS